MVEDVRVEDAMIDKPHRLDLTATLNAISVVAPVIYGPVMLAAPRTTAVTFPCAKCSCTGIYVDYAGPGVSGGILTGCEKCGGKGWHS